MVESVTRGPEMAKKLPKKKLKKSKPKAERKFPPPKGGKDDFIRPDRASY